MERNGRDSTRGSRGTGWKRWVAALLFAVVATWQVGGAQASEDGDALLAKLEQITSSLTELQQSTTHLSSKVEDTQKQTEERLSGLFAQLQGAPLGSSPHTPKPSGAGAAGGEEAGAGAGREEQRHCRRFVVPGSAGAAEAGGSRVRLRGETVVSARGEPVHLCAPPGLRDLDQWARGLTHEGKATSPLTDAQLDRSVVSAGQGGRFDRFIDKLLKGEGVTVAILGGSITAESHDIQEGIRETALRDLYGWGVHAWGWKFFDWLNNTFPHPNNRYANGAVPGTKSSYMEVCLGAHLTEAERAQADLVVLEYGVNDHPAEHWSMERLIRKTLALPSSPAVVVLNVNTWYNFDLASPLAGATSKGMAIRDHFDYVGGLQSAEYGYTTLAQYYTLPVLSFYRATYVEAHWQQEGYRIPQSKQEELGDAFFIQENLSHPNPRGQNMLGQMMVHLVQEAVVRAVLHPHAEGVRGRQVAGTESGAGGLLDSPDLSLPPPLLEGNWGNQSYGCWYGEAMNSLVTENSGWKITDDAKPGHPAKVGLTSTALGDKLTLKVFESVHNAHADMILAFLMSYDKRMGVMSVVCHGGCTCRCDLSVPRTNDYCKDLAGEDGSRYMLVDSIWNFDTSQTQALHMKVQRRKLGEACSVSVEHIKRVPIDEQDVLNQSEIADRGNLEQVAKVKDFRDAAAAAAENGEVKVKLMSVMTSEAEGGKIGLDNQITTVIDVLHHDD